MAPIGATAPRRLLAERRRRATRYDIALALRYIRMRPGDASVAGGGESLNISTTGLLFRCDGKPHNGDPITVILDWPVPGKDQEVLKLVITGVVVRVRRPLVAVSLYSHRLLPAKEIEGRLDVWSSRSSRSAARSEWRPSPPQRVLVDEDESVAQLITTVTTPQECVIERADPDRARQILASGESPVAFLITRTPALLESLPPEIPAILTVDESAPDMIVGQVGGVPGRFAIRRPLTVVVLRLLMRALGATHRFPSACGA